MFDYANYNLLDYLHVPGASYIELNDYADWDTDSLINSGSNAFIAGPVAGGGS